MSKETKNTNAFETPKNFLKRILYFLTEPVKSSAEADARKKELMPYTLISAGAFVLFIVLGGLIEPVQTVFEIIGYIVGAVALVFGWCLYKAISLRKKFIKLECTNCKTVIKYSPDFSIDVKDQSFKITETKTQNSKAGMDIKVVGVETARVAIGCKCQECGTEKTIEERFVTINCQTHRNGVSAITADVLLLEMKKMVEEAYKNNFENYSSDIKVRKKITPEQAVKDFFNEDGKASGLKVTKTAK